MTQQVSTDWTAETTRDLQSPAIGGRLPNSGSPLLVAVFTREADRDLALAAPAMYEALKDVLRILEAVRYTAGLGKKQVERIEAAKSALAKAREALAGE